MKVLINLFFLEFCCLLGSVDKDFHSHSVTSDIDSS